MLKLARPTEPAWVEAATANLELVLLDHAHCEKKAAGAALRLLFQYPQYGFLQRPIAELAREELLHFERVLGLLEARGITHRSLSPAAYGARLQAEVRREEPRRVMDQLLVAALIEARSCERMKLLAEAIAEPELSKFYSGLLAAEARHHRLYVELAEEVADPAWVAPRLEELAAREATFFGDPNAPVRFHS
ncbi:MAG: tRNA-(ms[2]io[6]A)-hydroxylase [Myxococcota bacterium]|nr:tRNA-(ms[2]io[6]A)-hydroxylase [Myxococcota bacterium]